MTWKIRKDGKFDTGRPQRIDDEVLRKLHQAFCIGCNDEEACSYANIAPSTLYKYQANNPEYSEYKERLKEKPILEARNTVVNNLRKDPKLALEYLKCKKKDEFGTRTELAGIDGKPIAIQQTVDIEKVKEFKEMLGV